MYDGFCPCEPCNGCIWSKNSKLSLYYTHSFAQTPPNLANKYRLRSISKELACIVQLFNSISFGWEHSLHCIQSIVFCNFLPQFNHLIYRYVYWYQVRICTTVKVGLGIYVGTPFTDNTNIKSQNLYTLTTTIIWLRARSYYGKRGRAQKNIATCVVPLLSIYTYIICIQRKSSHNDKNI